MQARTGGPRGWTLLLAGAAASGALLLLIHFDPDRGYTAVVVLLVLAALGSIAYIAWHLEPAWLLAGALVLSSFNNHWDAFGLPSLVAPDRMLLVGGLAAVLLRAPRVRDRPPIDVKPIHWLLLLTLLYAAGSAFAAGTITQSEAYFGLADRMAVPFAVFLLAPYAFRSAHQRRILLGALVGFGGYLGLTALFETLGPNALVWPKFILDPSVGLHEGRARGPFVEAAINGFGLYVGAVAGAIAAMSWKSPRWRGCAAAVTLLCLLGTLFTVTRSVWLATVVATVITMLTIRELRRILIPAVLAGAAIVLGVFAINSSFERQAVDRGGAERSVWERQNSNATAWAMIEERPVFGFGFDTFQETSMDYPQLLDDVPVTTTRPELHNVFLLMGTELGLVGALLFVFSFMLAVGSAVTSRGPPDLYPWRLGILAVAIAWVMIAAFVPFGQVFPNLAPWLLAGVIRGGAVDALPQAVTARRFPLPRAPRGRHPAPVT
jgi:O-antigen ligase